MAVRDCYSSTQEVKEDVLEIQGHPQVCIQVKSGLHETLSQIKEERLERNFSEVVKASGSELRSPQLLGQCVSLPLIAALQKEPQSKLGLWASSWFDRLTLLQSINWRASRNIPDIGSCLHTNVHPPI